MRAWVLIVVSSVATRLAAADAPVAAQDPREACLAERARRQREALAIADLAERTRQLQALPDCGPRPVAAPPVVVQPSRGTPPLRGSRIKRQLVAGLLAEAGSVALGALLLPCSGVLCDDGLARALLGGGLIGLVAMPITIGVVGNAGPEHGSILLMVVGVHVGLAATAGIAELNQGAGFASFAVLPLGLGVLGFNLIRGYDEVSVQPVVTRDASGGTVFSLAGAF